jgi:hypothetical protein
MYQAMKHKCHRSHRVNELIDQGQPKVSFHPFVVMVVWAFGEIYMVLAHGSRFCIGKTNSAFQPVRSAGG